jgi:hypothetical protein
MLTIEASDGTLHMVIRGDETREDRVDVSPECEGLQVACFSMPEGKTFRGHRHIHRPRTIPQTQETWIVISGSVRAMYYDVAGKHLGNHVLNAGDCSITFRGGHNYESLEDGSTVYEVKLGPFVGVEADKAYIG